MQTKRSKYLEYHLIPTEIDCRGYFFTLFYDDMNGKERVYQHIKAQGTRMMFVCLAFFDYTFIYWGCWLENLVYA